jgi:hypothetical protein
MNGDSLQARIIRLDHIRITRQKEEYPKVKSYASEFWGVAFYIYVRITNVWCLLFLQQV